MQLLTVKQAAKQLCISLSMAYRLIANGEIPSYGIGGCIRVRIDDLEKFLESRRRETVNLPKTRKRHF